MPVTVAEDAFHRPHFATYLGEELKVDSIEQQWQVDAESWDQKPVSKLHYKVIPEDGRRMTLFKNMDHVRWRQHRGMKLIRGSRWLGRPYQCIKIRVRTSLADSNGPNKISGGFG